MSLFLFRRRCVIVLLSGFSNLAVAEVPELTGRSWAVRDGLLNLHSHSV